MFIAASFAAFFIPGNLLLKRLQLDILSETVLSILTGFAIWSLLGFVVGFTHIRFILPIYVFLCLIFWIKINGFSYYRKLETLRFDKKLTIIILIGTLIQLSSVFLNGIRFNEGVYFCCGLPDTLFHLSLTNELIKNFPPHEPALSNVPLQNYHFLSSLGLSDLINVFGLPLVNTSYQYAAVLFSLLLGLSALTLAKLLGLSMKFKIIFLFFIYFSGDIIFLLPFLTGSGINFTLTTLENASSLWVSPPRFYSLTILFAGLSLFILWIKKRDMFIGLIMAAVFGSLIGFKVYTAAIILSGLGILSLYFLYKRNFNMLLPIILTFVISCVLYLPINSGAGGLVFTGFWRFQDFIVQESLHLSHLELARKIYLENNNILRSLSYDLLYAFLYIVFSSGILILGLLQNKKTLKKLPTELNILLLSGLLITCFLGFFFMQKTGGANSSQFLISMYVVGAFYAALSISSWNKKIPKILSIIICTVIIGITSTRVIHDTYLRVEKIINLEGAFISNETLDAYTFLSTINLHDVILVNNPVSLDCLLIPFMSDRTPYVCELGAPGDRGRDIRNRITLTKKVFTSYDMDLTKENISYLYIRKTDINPNELHKVSYKKVFENNEVLILNVKD